MLSGSFLCVFLHGVVLVAAYPGDTPAPTTTKTPCPEIVCTLDCEFGYVLDREGCERCYCKANPCTSGEPLRADNQLVMCGQASCPEGYDCNADVCCPIVVQANCSPKQCGCLKRKTATCLSRGLMECNTCDAGCPAGKCCCRARATGQMIVRETFTCAAQDTCQCREETCYERGSEYCQCKNCPKNQCCCDTPVERCSGMSCRCRMKGSRSCAARGLAYCPPENCEGDCPGQYCCCNKINRCTQEVMDQCMTFCMDRGQVVVEGSDCLWCQCQDVCALTVCAEGETCEAQPVDCVNPPCPPIPVCVCTQEVKDQCKAFCFEQRKVVLEGSECDCQCRDICALTVCAEDEKCEAQLDSDCANPPCPIPVCVKLTVDAY